MQRYYAEQALLPDGWAEAVTIEVAPTGTIAAIVIGSPSSSAQRLAGPVIPGIPNLHSHAFQRAMAGLAEGGAGDFWEWRDLMYRFLARIGPEEVEAIAAQLYLEMLKAGYTAVGEFHYLHHAPDGQPYDDLTEMAHRVIAGARRVGMGMTLLPVLYAHGDFGGTPPGEGQKRFVNDPSQLLRMLDLLIRDYGDDHPQLRFGVAPHSLRAVTAEELAVLVAGAQVVDPMVPVHIHVAEQTREVEACLASRGARPVEWLLAEAPVDGRWCLVHATHMTPVETQALAGSDAVAGLCPTTEANLGDGLFPLGRYFTGGGKIGIGSDSHISVSPVEEMRWLEYGQRLVRRARGMFRMPDRSVGRSLLDAALAGGAQALGRPIGRLEMGCRADLLVLDAESPPLFGKSSDHLADAFVFAGNANPVRDVMVGGAWVVQEGRHGAEEAVYAAYRRALERLTA